MTADLVHFPNLRPGPNVTIPPAETKLRVPSGLMAWHVTFLLQMADWPLPLLPGQRATLRWIAEQLGTGATSGDRPAPTPLHLVPR